MTCQGLRIGTYAGVCAIVVGILVAGPMQPSAASVSDRARRIQLAKDQEKLGNLEEALRIYRDLYARQGRIDFLYRLESLLTRLERFQEAVDLLAARTEEAPTDVNARIKLGSALVALGRIDEGFAEWESILDTAPKENAFLIVANLYRKHNLHDRVAAVYRRGRLQLKKPALFARELARLAERKGRYDEAVIEYLRFLDDKPQYRPVIQQHLREFTADDDRRQTIFGYLASEVSADPANRTRILLFVEYADDAGMLGQALRVMQDHAARADREAWRQISRRALKSREYDVAAGAFGQMLQRGGQRSASLLGMAMAEEGRGRYEEASRFYDLLLQEESRVSTVHEARYRLGRMRHLHEGRLQDALEILMPLVDAPRQTEWRNRAAFEVAELLVRVDRLAEARERLHRIQRESKEQDDVEQAQMLLAEIHFLDARFDTAGTHLAALLSGSPTRYILNDALELNALLQQGSREFPGVLEVLALARRDLRQGRPADAMEALNDAIDSRAGQVGIDHLLSLRIESLQILGRPHDIIETCRRMLEEVPGSPMCPSAAITLAQTFEQELGERESALEAYEKVLVDYPLSLEADTARDRIRSLHDTSTPTKEAG